MRKSCWRAWQHDAYAVSNLLYKLTGNGSWIDIVRIATERQKTAKLQQIIEHVSGLTTHVTCACRHISKSHIRA